MLPNDAHLLITGGTGFFGCSILRYILSFYANVEDYPRVDVLTRTPERFVRGYPEFATVPWLRFCTGDITQRETLPTNERYTHILHAAADSTLGPSMSPLQRYDQIINGTRNLLDLAVACHARRFLFISSGAAYGVQPAHLEKFPEDWNGMPDPLDPAHAYGVAKRAAEHLCALYRQAYGLHTVIARCFAFLGPDLPLDVHFAIGNFIRDALWRDAITVAGDGTPLRSYLDQEDLAHWLLTLLDRGGKGQAYNVGSDQAISIAELAVLVRDIVAPEKTVRILGKAGDTTERNGYIPSISKSRKELGLDVRIRLADSIKATAHAALQRSCRNQ